MLFGISVFLDIHRDSLQKRQKYTTYLNPLFLAIIILVLKYNTTFTKKLDPLILVFIGLVLLVCSVLMTLSLNNRNGYTSILKQKESKVICGLKKQSLYNVLSAKFFACSMFSLILIFVSLLATTITFDKAIGQDIVLGVLIYLLFMTVNTFIINLTDYSFTLYGCDDEKEQREKDAESKRKKETERNKKKEENAKEQEKNKKEYENCQKK